jgi:hypothetical protein
MVLRIILDVVKRKWIVLAFAVFQLSLMIKFIWHIWPGADVWSAPLAGAWMLTTAPGPMLQGREFYQLPVSRRTWWLARWWLSTAGVAVIATLGVVAGHFQSDRPRETAGQLALFATFAFLYGGCAMLLSATRVGANLDQPIDRQPKLSPPGTFKNEPVNRRWMLFKVLLRVLVTMLGLAIVTMAAPFVFARLLPHSFGEIGATSTLAMIVMIVMLGSTAFSFLHQPATVARPNMRRPARADAAPATPAARSTQPESAAKRTVADRLTGWRLALWNECGKQLIVFSSLIVLVVFGWAVSSLFRHVPPLAVFLSNVDALPFASHSAHVTEFVTWGFMFLSIGMYELATPSRIRAMRTLPISTNQLSCLPLAIGLVSATVLWTVLAALHLLILRTAPIAPRVDLFLAFAGLLALSHAARIIAPGQPQIRGLIAFTPFAAVMLAGGFFIDSWHPEIVQPIMFAGGLTALMLSFTLMRILLARNSRMYRPPTIVARFQ